MTLAVLSLAPLLAAAQELEEHKAVQPTLSLRLTDEVIDKAVRETLAEQKGKAGMQAGMQPERTLSGDAYRKFERAFSEAEKPDCLHPDAMKFQPHGVTFKLFGQTYGMGVGGQLAIPFWIAAIVRGKCN